MWQNIIIWVIIALCLIFLGNRYYRQWRSALSRDSGDDCIESSCCGCSSSSCTSASQFKVVDNKK